MEKIKVKVAKDADGRLIAIHKRNIMEINTHDLDNIEVNKEYEGYAKTIKLPARPGDKVVVTCVVLYKTFDLAKKLNKQVLEGTVIEARTKSKYLIDFGETIAILDRKNFSIYRSRKDFFQIFGLTDEFDD